VKSIALPAEFIGALAQLPAARLILAAGALLGKPSTRASETVADGMPSRLAPCPGLYSPAARGKLLTPRGSGRCSNSHRPWY